ncbi:hypothetical protein DPMN_071987 [Dreissena polymorpha]|uniref:Uncharacterized protein n=1 Tax=Dreissena polymorpha TaxID=45954 RepID=A0A9D4BXG2_DREPO|nr:hypothetical protein DPMN_071987 [Dreissena polymorpha]
MQNSTRIYALAFLLIGALLLANFRQAVGSLCMRGRGGRCVEANPERHEQPGETVCVRILVMDADVVAVRSSKISESPRD